MFVCAHKCCVFVSHCALHSLFQFIVSTHTWYVIHLTTCTKTCIAAILLINLINLVCSDLVPFLQTCCAMVTSIFIVPKRDIHTTHKLTIVEFIVLIKLHVC